MSYVGAMGVTVDLSEPDGSNNAGGQAEGDTITNVENVTGTRHDDVLTGDDQANRLEGNDGNDMLTGGDGADELIGGEGNDTASYADSDAGVTVTLEGQSVDEDGNPDGPPRALVATPRVTSSLVSRTSSARTVTTSSPATTRRTGCTATRATTRSPAARATTCWTAARAPTRSPAARAPTC